MSDGAEMSLLSMSTEKFMLFVLVYCIILWNRQTIWLWWKGLTLPPGPPRQLIIGNKYQLPLAFPWLRYTTWSKIYGPILSFEVFNGVTIVLSSAKAVTDLLEARSIKYSNRPDMWMARLAGRGKSIVLMDSDDPRFNPYRKLLQNGLSSTASKKYKPIQAEAAQVLLRSLLKTPENFCDHIRRNAVAVIMKVAYGYSVAEKDDRMVKIIEDGFRHTGPINIPGRYLVETVPILRFLPDWFPGTGFKKFAKVIEKSMEPIQTVPFQWAIENISSGQYVESYISHHLHIEGGEVLNDVATQEAIQWTCSALFIGGGDSLVAAMSSFMFLMCVHPEVQKRAQADIDKVASYRLPTLEDLDSLPFVVAVIKEVVRWATVTPLGLPHKVAEDDLYEGYFIPKGATIIPNIWAITHDEDIYPDPFKFDPERHLGTNPEPDPFKFIFGYGRRVCPGAYLAQKSLFLNTASILAVFNILKPLNNDGFEVEPKKEWKSGVSLHLEPFECRIKPRSPEHLVYLEKT